jgi:ABC-type branched-subunit amino acid transport system substrate-binding protein
VELVLEDDRSDPRELEGVLRGLSGQCDILLGPYSTQLMRKAGQTAVELDRLLWNHGGSGDDVETAYPGHVVSVPTPAGRYAEPFIRHLVEGGDLDRLWIAQGKGSFGRQVADGAEVFANELGVQVVRAGSTDVPPSTGWAVLCAGSFEEDVEVVGRVRGSRAVCAVAAGVREFGRAVEDPRGIYGVGQWFPGDRDDIAVGISERGFLDAYRDRIGALPDYPAVQAAASAVIASHCAELTGSTAREQLWAAATALETTTLFGSFKIDPRTGAQLGHRAALVRWEAGGPAALGAYGS